MPSPNIVFICPDQLGFRALSPYGNEAVRTPNIERMAEEGVVFTNFYANSALCGPSRHAIFTGQMPFGHPDWAQPNCLHMPEHTYMGSVFQKQGYETCSIGKLHGMPEDFEFGFAYCKQNWAYASLPGINEYGEWLNEQLSHRSDGEEIRACIGNNKGYGARKMQEPEYFIPPELSEERWMVNQVDEYFRRRDSDRPFFLHLGFRHPHPSWHSIPAEDEKYDPEQIPLAPDQAEKHDTPIQNMLQSKKRGASEEDWRGFMAQYYTSVTQVDKAIGKVFDLLEEYGYAENTVVVLTSDHGEMLGSKQLTGKTCFYEDSAHIPFIIQGAGIPRGERRTQLGEQIDIIPTLLALCDSEEGEAFPGKSQLPVINDASVCGKNFVHGWLDRSGYRHEMVCSERYKLYRAFSNRKDVQPKEAIELYDLIEDPYELHNLWPDELPEDVEPLITEFHEYFWRNAGTVGTTDSISAS